MWILQGVEGPLESPRTTKGGTPLEEINGFLLFSSPCPKSSARIISSDLMLAYISYTFLTKNI
jgi:hypothetical protein